MKTIEEIIVDKEYNELTQEELNLVAELAENEQEYKAMRSLFSQMETEVIPDSAFTASDATKKSLDSIFMAKYPVIAQDWKKEEVEEETKVVPFYNNNWFRAAAVLLLFSGVSYFYFQNDDLAELRSTEKRSMAIQTPATTKSTIITEDNSTSTFKAETNDQTTHSAPIVDEIEMDKADFADAEVAFETSSVSAFNGSVSGSSASLSWKDMGMSADLNPNGVTAGTDGDALSEGSSTEVTTEDMLGWIQTVY